MENFDDNLSETQTAPREATVPCEFICGCAGTGKTYGIKKAVATDPTYGVLSSTTGISAVNLGAITIHSLLRYSTTEVLKDHFLRGGLTRVMRDLARNYRRIIIDEISMSDGVQLDFWYRAAAEVNSRLPEGEPPLGITLVGDFAQLPPVKAKWAFEAECWPEFEQHTTRLDKVWRQDGGKFLDALNHTRSGNGFTARDLLTDAAGLGAWNTMVDQEFEGTTILSKNDQVGRFNAIALDRVKEKKFFVESRRWGKQQPEWGENFRTHEWGIPTRLELKVGAYVMVLANAADFSYVNGDCGWVREWNPDEGSVEVELVRRPGETITIPKIIREVSYRDKPDGLGEVDKQGEKSWNTTPHYRRDHKTWVMGQVEYLPVRLAYSTTVHKSQSLTLDRVQVDFRDRFVGSPGMLYVALSRCRTLQGLRLVGHPDVFAQRCVVDEKVRRWL